MRISLKSTAECFHFFANKVQAEGYSGNVRFSGNFLYSYREVIGKWLPDGSLAVAARYYSSTTASHRADLRRAVPPSVKVINVYEIGAVADVFRQARVMSENLFKTAVTARVRGDEYRRQAREIVENANAYAAAMGEAVRMEVARLTPEQELAHRKAVKDANKLAKAKLAEREAIILRTHSEQLDKWLAGDTATSAYGFRSLGVRLRVRGNVVETTQGASIPLDDAIKLWPLVQRCKAGDKCFTPGHPLGNYKLTKIRGNGSIVVGCHDVPYSELERIATQLNLV